MKKFKILMSWFCVAFALLGAVNWAARSFADQISHSLAKKVSWELDILPESTRLTSRVVSVEGNYSRCDIENLCLNDEYGLFVVSDDPDHEFPKIWASGVNFPQWEYQIAPVKVPTSALRQAETVFHKDTLLVVAGTFSSFHLSHMFMNSVVPILSVLTSLEENPPDSFNQSTTVHRHLLTVGRYQTSGEATYKFPIDYLGFDALFTTGFFSRSLEGVLDPAEYRNDPLPILDGRSMEGNVLGGLTHCYPFGVLGVNRTCAGCPTKPTRTVYATLRSLVLRYYGLQEEKEAGAGKRLLVVLRQGRRRVLNMDEVLESLEGFAAEVSVVRLEEMDFREQVRAFAEADVVLAPHGNGNVHLHWMRPGSVLLELFNPNGYGETFFEQPATQAGLIYHPLFCTDARCDALRQRGGDGKFMDLFANTEEVLSVVGKYLRRKV